METQDFNFHHDIVDSVLPHFFEGPDGNLLFAEAGIDTILAELEKLRARADLIDAVLTLLSFSHFLHEQERTRALAPIFSAAADLAWPEIKRRIEVNQGRSIGLVSDEERRMRGESSYLPPTEDRSDGIKLSEISPVPKCFKP